MPGILWPLVVGILIALVMLDSGNWPDNWPGGGGASGGRVVGLVDDDDGEALARWYDDGGMPGGEP